jgi:hypothetical protein
VAILRLTRQHPVPRRQPRAGRACRDAATRLRAARPHTPVTRSRQAGPTPGRRPRASHWVSTSSTDAGAATTGLLPGLDELNRRWGGDHALVEPVETTRPVTGSRRARPTPGRDHTSVEPVETPRDGLWTEPTDAHTTCRRRGTGARFSCSIEGSKLDGSKRLDASAPAAAHRTMFRRP